MPTNAPPILTLLPKRYVMIGHRIYLPPLSFQKRCWRMTCKIFRHILFGLWMISGLIGSFTMADYLGLGNLALGWQIPLLTFVIIIMSVIMLMPPIIWIVWRELLPQQQQQKTLWVPPPFELLQRRWQYHQLRAVSSSEKTWPSPLAKEMDGLLALCVEDLGFTSLAKLTQPELVDWYEQGNLPRILKILTDTPKKKREDE